MLQARSPSDTCDGRRIRANLTPVFLAGEEDPIDGTTNFVYGIKLSCATCLRLALLSSLQDFRMSYMRHQGLSLDLSASDGVALITHHSLYTNYVPGASK